MKWNSNPQHKHNTAQKKCNFLLRISLVNVTKSAVSHLLKKSLIENSIFYLVQLVSKDSHSTRKCQDKVTQS